MLCLLNILTASHRKNPNLIQISARPWLYEQNLTRLSQVPDSVLDDLVLKGIDSFYLLGVWSVGEYGKNFDRTNQDLLNDYHKYLPDYTTEDAIGCPFAITDYSVNSEEIATESELMVFKQRLNKRGMVLYLDFVPNHSAVDALLVSSNPDLFIKSTFQDANRQYKNGMYYGGASSWNTVWRDTIQFNYFNPDTVQARIDDLMRAAKLSDGVRCDVAMMPLNDFFELNWKDIVYQQGYKKPTQEFWKVAIDAVKAKYPDFKFVAEVYDESQGDTLIGLGFDYLYDKVGLYDKLSAGNVEDVKNYIQTRSAKLGFGTHFVENHDEARAASHFGSTYVADAAALVSFTLPGMRFHFQGQWLGRKNKLEIHLRRSYDMAHDVDQPTVMDYDILLPILKDAVWHEGKWTYKDVQGTGDCWRLMAWTWETADQSVLVVVNYSDQMASGKVRLDVNDGKIVFEDKMTGMKQEGDGQDVRDNGLFVQMDKYWAGIYYYNK
ncbi:Alpha_amylase catalytic region [Hexamita inflata]|uniref:Alpha amylase catalytic region n=1 Tax=Hexamita inflata TaxID=28002 RepID=A0AA86REV3_9EUKA|nr:Alpha amylase catalytic region [Hexamita inflata]